MSSNDHHELEEVSAKIGTPANGATTAVEIKSYNKAREAFRLRDINMTRAEHAKKSTFDHAETHGGAGSEYVKSIVFGGLDGIITIFAIITAAAGSGGDWRTVLVFGIANCIADAFSMGFGEYVGGAAEREFALKEREREEWEVANCPDVEIQEMIELYQEKGISEEDAIEFVSIISKDPKVFVDFMMVDELGILIDTEDEYGPMKQGCVMFLSFLCFGMVPLSAYFGGKGQGTDSVFAVSVFLTAVALICLGAYKGYLTSMSMPKAAFLMFLNGCISGGVSFVVGIAVESFIRGY